MKKIILALLLLAPAAMTWAQPGSKTKAPVKPVTNSLPAAGSLKSLNDSASYAIGINVASFYKQQGISNINTTLLAKAMNDIMSGKKPLLDDEAANMCVNRLMTKVQEDKSAPVIAEGEAFLAKNKTKPGVKTTASGLQYEVLREGSGERPGASDSVTVNYRGTLINGTEFDNSYSRGQPITFPLYRVIPGWTEALQLMTVGAKHKLYIPYNLAYGANDQGQIPGGSTLIFEVELLDVKKAK